MENDSKTSETSEVELLRSGCRPGNDSDESRAPDDENNASNPPVPDLPSDAYFDVAYLTWRYEQPPTPEQICGFLSYRYETLKDLTKDQVLQIQKWLATDEGKKDGDLKKWAMEMPDLDAALRSKQAHSILSFRQSGEGKTPSKWNSLMGCIRITNVERETNTE